LSIYISHHIVVLMMSDLDSRNI